MRELDPKTSVVRAAGILPLPDSILVLRVVLVSFAPPQLGVPVALQLVDVAAVGPRNGRSTGGGGRVGVHYVDPGELDVARGASVAGPGATGEADRGLAAAVVEELDVGAAEVTVGHAVQQVVEARLGQGEPGQVHHHLRTHRLHL